MVCCNLCMCRIRQIFESATHWSAPDWVTVFLSGIPVGTVNRVEHDSGKPFALVTAVPSASLAKSRHVLLVFTEEQMGRANAGQGAGQVEAAGGAHAQ